MEKQGVVGTAIGLDENGDHQVLVLLEHGNVAGIPVQLDGVKVKKEVTGKFYAREDTARYIRPVPIGVSTGHPDITAGTIGCRVKDDSGNVYALSNNHVYANSNAASIGDEVIQPGTFDGGINPTVWPFDAIDVIGTLADFVPIDFSPRARNEMDAAIAATTTAQVGTATPLGMQPSWDTERAVVGLAVKKHGRTTGETVGTVYAVNASVRVGYGSAGVARFVKQIIITPGTFSDGGDSGSLIVTQNGNKAVALLFAGSSSSTIGSPIDKILARFGVTIDGGSGGTENTSPTADFSYATSELTATFTDQSTDPDGSVVSWDWDFGDGGASTAQSPSHTYGADGTYTVTLTVTDNDGATGTTSQPVSVSGGGGGGTVAMDVSDITFATAGPHLKVFITVASSTGPVSGIGVTADLVYADRVIPLSDVTDSEGQVGFLIKGGNSACELKYLNLDDLRDPDDYVWVDLFVDPDTTYP